MSQSAGNEMKRAKHFALISLIIIQLSSCGLIPASSSPEIESEKKEKIKSGKIDEGYKRVFVCMGSVSTEMPENLVIKEVSNVPRNSKISFFKSGKLLGSINFYEAAVFDYQQLEMIKYEWSNEIKPVASFFGDGKIGEDALFLSFDEEITEISVGMSGRMSRIVGGVTVMRPVPGTRLVSRGKVGGEEVGGLPNREALQKKSGICSDKNIVLYERF